MQNGHPQRVSRRLARRRGERDGHILGRVLDGQRDERQCQSAEQPDDYPRPYQAEEQVDHGQRKQEKRVVGVERRVGRTEAVPVHPQQHRLPLTAHHGPADDADDERDARPHPGDDPAPAAVELRCGHRPTDHVDTNQQTGDAQSDQKQHHVRHQRRPEDVGVAQRTVEEVVAAQTEQPARDEEQHDQHRHDRGADEPPTVAAGLPDDAGTAGAPPEELLGIEAERAHLAGKTSGGSAAGGRRMDRAAGGPDGRPPGGSAPCTAPADAAPPLWRRR